jgi:Mn2+/Fe2+ NRAMP family transporter
MEKPDWNTIGVALATPSFRFETGFITIAITIIGTTIAPWMQFYQQSAIADKGLKPSDYKLERLDVIIGSLFAIFVASFITIACAIALYKNGIRIETAKDAALALRSLAGPYSATLFAVGLLNASLFSAAILPLTTAYVVCEAFGWESGVNKNIREAPVFFGIYSAIIVIGAGVILLPIKSLIEVMMASQTLNGILLPVILIVMLRLVNDRQLMGDKFVNGRVFNALSWTVVAAIILLTGSLVVVTLMGVKY